MREIKFRAFDPFKKKWVESFVMAFCDWGMEVTIIGDGALIPSRYTGLKDKRDVEIYEGDIVSVPYVNPIGRLCPDDEDRKATVVFENGGFYLTDYGRNQSISYWQRRGQEKYVPNFGEVVELLEDTALMVIGNIYENPELLG